MGLTEAQRQAQQQAAADFKAAKKRLGKFGGVSGSETGRIGAALGRIQTKEEAIATLIQQKGFSTQRASEIEKFARGRNISIGAAIKLIENAQLRTGTTQEQIKRQRGQVTIAGQEIIFRIQEQLATPQELARIAAVLGISKAALQSFLKKATPQEREELLADVKGGTLGTKGTVRVGPKGERLFLRTEVPSKRTIREKLAEKEKIRREQEERGFIVPLQETLKEISERREFRFETLETIKRFIERVPILREADILKGATKGAISLAFAPIEFISTGVETLALAGTRLAEGDFKKVFESAKKASEPKGLLIETGKGFIPEGATIAEKVGFAAAQVAILSIPALRGITRTVEFKAETRPLVKEILKKTDIETGLTKTFLRAIIPTEVRISRILRREKKLKVLTAVEIEARQFKPDVTFIRERFQTKFLDKTGRKIEGELKGVAVTDKILGKDVTVGLGVETIKGIDFLVRDISKETLRVKIRDPILTDTGKILPRIDIARIETIGDILKPIRRLRIVEKPILKFDEAGLLLRRRVSRRIVLEQDVKVLGLEKGTAFLQRLMKQQESFAKDVGAGPTITKTVRKVFDVPLTSLKILEKAQQKAIKKIILDTQRTSAKAEAVAVAASRGILPSRFAAKGLFERTEAFAPTINIQRLAQTPKIALLTTPITSQILRQIEKSITKQLTRSATKQITRPVTKQIVKPVTKEIQKTQLKSILKSIQKSISRDLLRVTVKPTVALKVPIIPFALPSLKSLGITPRKRRRFTQRALLGFIPSFTARALDIKVGISPKELERLTKTVFTGAELRPQVFVNTKKLTRGLI